MLMRKLYKLLLIISLFFIAQCYKAPVFELNIAIQDQDFNPVANTSVRITTTDPETGDIIPNDLDEENLMKITGADGTCSFSFEKKAFVTIQACVASSNANNLFACQEAYAYLEENETVSKTLMLVDGECDYCPF